MSSNNSYQKILYNELVDFYQFMAKDGYDGARLRGLIGSLVRKARKSIPAEWDKKTRIHHLLQLVYGDWGFCCDSETYFYSRNIYLPYILQERCGMPVSLGAIVLYLAASLDLPIYPVNFPTQLMLRAEINNEVAFINPWDGKYISQEDLHKFYEGAFGFAAKMQPDDLARAQPAMLQNRFRQLAKNTLIREEENEIALDYIEYLLKEQKDPYDIRDRGLVLAQMGAYGAAMNDLEYFLKECPQDPMSSLLKVQLLELKGEIEKNDYWAH